MKKSSCSIPGCDKPTNHRGWCCAHYNRWRRHGDPVGGATGKGEAQRFYYEEVLAYDGEECLVWPFATKNGYGVVRLNGRMEVVSRLVCEEDNGPPPTPFHQAAHSCGRGHLGCVAKRHLSWKTRSENEADKVGHGTSPHGERNGQATITDATADQIRSLRGLMSQRKIAAQLGVTQSAVHKIQTGQRRGFSSSRLWKPLTQEHDHD